MNPQPKPKTSLDKPRRERDAQYLAWIRKLPCVVSEHGRGIRVCNGSIEASHVREHGHGGLATKPADRRAIPKCHYHHERFHLLGRSEFEVIYDISLEAVIRQYNATYDATHKPQVKKERAVSPKHKGITKRTKRWAIVTESGKIHRICDEGARKPQPASYFRVVRVEVRECRS